MAADTRLEFLVADADAELARAIPGTGTAIGGVEIIVTRLQPPRHHGIAFIGRDNPPPLAHPCGSVEAAHRHARGFCRAVAHAQSGMRGQGQKGEREQAGPESGGESHGQHVAQARGPVNARLRYAVPMDEPAFELLTPAARRADILFVCDHASNAVPKAYGTLGLEEGAFVAHIAYDIGAAQVTRALAQAYGAPAVLARWSRLLIDLNRGADDPTLVMKLSDGRIIPGNRNADAAEVEKRIELFHRSYHAAIAEQIAKLRDAGVIPTVISMHSFTPVWKGFRRPWEVGVLWDKDGRLAHPLMAALKRAGFIVGDNEPYRGELEGDCMYVHGSLNGLPHVLIEIRQDLIAELGAAEAFAARLKPIIDEALKAMGPAEIEYSRGLRASK